MKKVLKIFTENFGKFENPPKMQQWCLTKTLDFNVINQKMVYFSQGKDKRTN